MVRIHGYKELDGVKVDYNILSDHDVYVEDGKLFLMIGSEAPIDTIKQALTRLFPNGTPHIAPASSKGDGKYEVSKITEDDSWVVNEIDKITTKQQSIEDFATRIIEASKHERERADQIAEFTVMVGTAMMESHLSSALDITKRKTVVDELAEALNEHVGKYLTGATKNLKFQSLEQTVSDVLDKSQSLQEMNGDISSANRNHFKSKLTRMLAERVGLKDIPPEKEADASQTESELSPKVPTTEELKASFSDALTAISKEIDNLKEKGKNSIEGRLIDSLSSALKIVSTAFDTGASPDVVSKSYIIPVKEAFRDLAQDLSEKGEEALRDECYKLCGQFDCTIEQHPLLTAAQRANGLTKAGSGQTKTR